MTNEGRTLREASQAYRESLNRLLSHTIARMPLIAVFNHRTGQATVSFRRDGTITALGADVSAPGGAEVIDCSGLSIYPGLIDAG